MKVSSHAFWVLGLLLLPACATQAHSLSKVFKEVDASVVEIYTEEAVMRRVNDHRLATIRRLGAGVLVSTDGKVLTASHLVQSADRIEVRFIEGEASGARVIASEPAADVSLLQVERAPHPAVVARLGDSSKVGIGDEIFILGSPYGMSHTMSVGHISAHYRRRIVLGDLTLGEYFQTDAVINKGSSGGPMFNVRGEVIGIVTSTLSRSGVFEGIGFAVTSNIARRLVLDRKSFWTGIDGYWLSGELAKVLNLPQPCGLLVQGIAAGSPAARLGLRAGTMEATIGDETLLIGGDVILEIQGVCLHDEESYGRARERMSRLTSGDTISMKVLRGGKVQVLTTTVIQSLE